MTTTKNYDYGYGGYTLDANALSQLRTLYKDISDNVPSASDGVDRGVAISLYKFILALALQLHFQH